MRPRRGRQIKMYRYGGQEVYDKEAHAPQDHTLHCAREHCSAGAERSGADSALRASRNEQDTSVLAALAQMRCAMVTETEELHYRYADDIRSA